MSRDIFSLIVLADGVGRDAAALDAAAHDVPTDVRVQVFVKPEGQRLNVLVRVPLRAILDVDIPKRGPGYLDLTRTEGPLREGATGWIASSLEFYEEGSRLTNERIAAVRVSLPSDPSFRSYEDALTHIRGAPLPTNTELYLGSGAARCLVGYPIQSPQSDFFIRPTFWRLGLGVRMTLLFLSAAGTSHPFALGGDPGLIALDPSRPQVARRFLESGLLHVMAGANQLLFLLCLVIPVRRLAALTPVVASFIVGYSIVLIGSAYDLAPAGPWFPPLIEVLLALSIIYLAFENISGWRLDRRVTAFSFGLLQGFGFSFVLRNGLQFAGAHLLTAVLSFNAGVIVGQLIMLIVLVVGLDLLFRIGVRERVGGIILSALAIHPSWHRTAETGAGLVQFSWLDVALLSSVMRWTTVMVALVGLGWFVFGFLEPWPDRTRLEDPVVGAEE